MTEPLKNPNSVVTRLSATSVSYTHLALTISRACSNTDSPITFSNGKDAIEQAQKDPPDIVFLDIMMGGIDGIHVLKSLKEIDESIYIVMLTCVNDFESARNALLFGADEYLSLIHILRQQKCHRCRDGTGKP